MQNYIMSDNVYHNRINQTFNWIMGERHHILLSILFSKALWFIKERDIYAKK